MQSAGWRRSKAAARGGVDRAAWAVFKDYDRRGWCWGLSKSLASVTFLSKCVIMEGCMPGGRRVIVGAKEESATNMNTRHMVQWFDFDAKERAPSL